MPLPAALAARLAKRGLITGSDKTEKTKKETKKKVHEEVIAEDYDTTKDEINQIDLSQKFMNVGAKDTLLLAATAVSNNKQPNATSPSQTDVRLTAQKRVTAVRQLKMGYAGCPNKYNIYHECNKKCKELWGVGHVQPSEKYLKLQVRLIQKYPLPETWKAVYDPGSGQHYYWDWSSDLVSWLPPGHPKCQISQPASQLREELHLKAADQDDNMSSDESGSDQETMEVDEVEYKKEQKIVIREKFKVPEVRRVQRPETGKEKKDRTLDPMDPASYSDIPRGKWSDGLARHNEAKTGADTTASGPLYQMRPYPSPGAVLRSNRTTKPEVEGTAKPVVSFPETPE